MNCFPLHFQFTKSLPPLKLNPIYFLFPKKKVILKRLYFSSRGFSTIKGKLLGLVRSAPRGIYFIYSAKGPYKTMWSYAEESTRIESYFVNRNLWSGELVSWANKKLIFRNRRTIKGKILPHMLN